MNLMSFLPVNLKELLRFVPTLLFDVVPWQSVLKDITLFSKRLMTKEGQEEAKQKLQNHLPRQVSFGQVIASQNKLLTVEQKKQFGDQLLTLYFEQVLNQTPIFLDLRLEHFNYQNNQLIWSPTGLWAQLSPTFQAGLSELYRGFYHANRGQFRQGLLATGLLKNDWSETDKQRMEELLLVSFGSAIDQEMSFDLKSFNDSFQKVFLFLLEKKVTLSTDFLCLGMMLVTLYLSLEELGQGHSVQKLFIVADQH